MKTHHYCKTGAYHLQEGQTCQDQLTVTVVGPYTVAALADGVSACRCGETGAQLACAAVVDFIDMEREHVFSYDPRKLAYLVMEHILYFLENESARTGNAVADYASTIMFSCVENNTGNAVLFGLGDGAVFQTSGTRILREISPKRYGGHPCLTTTEGAYQAAEIRRIQIPLGDSVLLCTDGFLHAMETDPACSEAFQHMMLEGTCAELETILEGADEPDDISYIQTTRTRRYRKDLT